MADTILVIGSYFLGKLATLAILMKMVDSWVAWVVVAELLMNVLPVGGGAGTSLSSAQKAVSKIYLTCRLISRIGGGLVEFRRIELGPVFSCEIG